ncbi:hypothetical protein C8Q74DRAFT_1367139 [Fomes fomentarius]|nr:hypothetical protein C8Q74DRAFT_1367139 [Fomes fomentarius]
MSDKPSIPQHWEKPLDESFYAPDDEEKTFMKVTTGIEDDEELKQHIIRVQTKAYAVQQYPCIRIFEFLRLKIARLPAYPTLLNLGKERPNAILLDLGCCFGNDVRKAVLDGVPVENIVASDIDPGFWELGHELFRTTPTSFPVRFLPGSIFDTTFLTLFPPLSTSLIPPSSLLESLSASSQQQQLARLLAGLLSPLPGSMLFGVQGGRPVKGPWGPGVDLKMHSHSPESWREMWEEIFAEVGCKVEVEGTLRREVGGETFFGMWPENEEGYYVLEWSVTRVSRG